MPNNNDIQNAILEAFDYAIGYTQDTIGVDKTIVATIDSSVDLSTGKYRLKYNGGTIYAYAQNGAAYSHAQSVYVLVPQGDFSNTKVIIAKATAVDSTNASVVNYTTALLNDYNIIGGSVLHNKEVSYSLNSYNNLHVKVLYDCNDDQYNDISVEEEDFLTYLQKADSLLIRGRFNTANLLEEHRKSLSGHYGLLIVFESIGGNGLLKDLSVRLDSKMMDGDPLRYGTYISQHQLVDLTGQTIQRVKQIYIYCQDFEPDSQQFNSHEDDIIIRDIEIICLRSIDAVNGDYKMSLSSLDGQIFETSAPENTTLTMSARVSYKTIDISQDCSYYWFIEDALVTSAVDEGYDIRGGLGWRKLPVSGNVFKTKKSDNSCYENRYLCVSSYNNETTLRTEFSIYNNANKYDIAMIATPSTTLYHDIGTVTVTCLVSNEGEDVTNDMTLVWSTTDSLSGTTFYQKTKDELAETKRQLSIAIGIIDAYADARGNQQAIEALLEEYGITDQATIDALENRTVKDEYRAVGMTLQYYKDVLIEGNIFQCEAEEIIDNMIVKCYVYDVNDVLKAIGSITIINSSITDENYRIVIENGNQVFQYDELGHSPASAAYKQYPITIEPLVCHFYDQNGFEVDEESFTCTWEIPSSMTMLEPSSYEVYEVFGTQCPFYISETYNPSYYDNQITCRIVFGREEISEQTEFTFVKMGDNGTNGTNVVAMSYISGINEDDELPYIVNNGDAQSSFWQPVGVSLQSSDVTLASRLYDNGTEVTSLATAAWSIDSSTVYDVTAGSGQIGFPSLDESDTEFHNMIFDCKLMYEGREYYSHIGIPTLYYESGVSGYFVEIDPKKTLRQIAYSGGKNPLYDVNRGVAFKVYTLSNNSRVYRSDLKAKWTSIGGKTETAPTFYVSDGKRNTKDYGMITTTANSDGVFEAYVIPHNYGSCAFKNNDVVVSVHDADNTKLFTLYVPIFTHENEFSYTTLNGWDGSSVRIDETGASDVRIVTPQMGAGSKDNNNRFTGIVMGTTTDGYSEKNGLFGYSHGRESIRLDSEDGSARFGISSEVNGSDKALIELIPDGDSTIGNWTIAPRALYACFDSNGPTSVSAPYSVTHLNSGSHRNYAVTGSTVGIGYDDKGVLFSSDPPYLSIKGAPISDEDDVLSEDSALQPGDCVELEVDPSKLSVFSIYRHSKDNGQPYRYPMVGINSSGQFYTNAVENEETGMSVGRVTAFGNADNYVGVRYAWQHAEYGKQNILKVFMESLNSNQIGETFATDGMTYITTGNSELGNSSNEYQRGLTINARTIELEAKSSSETAKNRLTLTNSLLAVGAYNSTTSALEHGIEFNSGTSKAKFKGELSLSTAAGAEFDFGTNSTIGAKGTLTIKSDGRTSQADSTSNKHDIKLLSENSIFLEAGKKTDDALYTGEINLSTCAKNSSGKITLSTSTETVDNKSKIVLSQNSALISILNSSSIENKISLNGDSDNSLDISTSGNSRMLINGSGKMFDILNQKGSIRLCSGRNSSSTDYNAMNLEADGAALVLYPGASGSESTGKIRMEVAGLKGASLNIYGGNSSETYSKYVTIGGTSYGGCIGTSSPMTVGGVCINSNLNSLTLPSLPNSVTDIEEYLGKYNKVGLWTNPDCGIYDRGVLRVEGEAELYGGLKVGVNKDSTVGIEAPFIKFFDETSSTDDHTINAAVIDIWNNKFAELGDSLSNAWGDISSLWSGPVGVNTLAGSLSTAWSNIGSLNDSVADIYYRLFAGLGTSWHVGSVPCATIQQVINAILDYI